MGNITLSILIFYILLGFLSSFFNVGGLSVSGNSSIEDDIEGFSTLSGDESMLTTTLNLVSSSINMIVFTFKMVTLQLSVSNNPLVNSFFNMFILLLNFMLLYDSRNLIFKIIEAIPFI